MKKLILIFAAACILSSCVNEAKQTVPTDNHEYKVELLFEVDGCKVYRFFDGGYKYFTNCNGETSWSEQQGKNNHVELSIPTNNEGSNR